MLLSLNGPQEPSTPTWVTNLVKGVGDPVGIFALSEVDQDGHHRPASINAGSQPPPSSLYVIFCLLPRWRTASR